MAVELDSSTSWVVAVSVSVLLTSTIWAYRCSSILFIGIINHFQISREEAAWPLTAFFVSSCLTGPFVGTLSQRFSIQSIFLLSTSFNTLAAILSSFARNTLELTFTMGLLLGISAGIPVTIGGVFVTRYFDKRRTAAIGVYMAGPAISSIILPSIMQYCQEEYQFSGSLLLIAGFSMQGIPAALLLYLIGEPVTSSDLKEPSLVNCIGDKAVDANPSGEKIPIVVLRQLGGNRVRRDTPRLSIEDSSHCDRNAASMQQVSKKSGNQQNFLHVFTMKWFYIIGLSNIAIISIFSTLLNLMEDFGRDKNLEPSLARNLVGLFATTDLIARLGSAWITDGGYMKREHLLMLNFCLKAGCHLCLGLVTNPWIILCVIATLGWLFGSSIILFIDISRERLGFHHLAHAAGWNLFFNGLFGLGRPATIGYFRERVGSYNPMMYVLCGILVSVVCIYFIGLLTDRHKEDSASLDLDADGKAMEFCRVRSVSFSPSLSST